MRVNLQNTAILFLLTFTTGYGQTKEYKIDSVTVTATRLEPQFSLPRSVGVITQSDINRYPVNSLSGILNYAPGVLMNSRGTSGVQSDPSLRGAGFEQVLILLDGVRMNDPQTGHHNTNIPVPVENIERIEILRGQGSVLYGPGAFGGVINIITKPASSERAAFRITTGSFNTSAASAAVTIPAKGLSNRFSFETSHSDGYADKSGWNLNPNVIPNTDYNIKSFNWAASFTGKKHSYSITSGILEKRFGAHNFYVNNGTEYERIQSSFSSFYGSFEHTQNFTSTIMLNFKQHRDHYALSRYNPLIYTADHTTERYGAEWTGRLRTGSFGSMTAGVEGSKEIIRSNRLGNWTAERVSVFGEYGNTFHNDIVLNVGTRVDHHNLWGTECNPSAGIGYIVSPAVLLKTSIGTSFRAPTFIELYNPQSSKNIGNPELKPETAITFDCGTDYTPGNRFKGSTTYFLRNQKRTIDWISADRIIFRAVNIFNIQTQGIEQELSFTYTGGDIRMPALKEGAFTAWYAYLTQNKKQQDIISRYVFTYPKHHLNLRSSVTLKRFNFSAAANYKDSPAFTSYWTIDGQIACTLGSLRVSVDGFNLTDKHYQEVRNILMPGRAFYLGVRYSR